MYFLRSLVLSGALVAMGAFVGACGEGPRAPGALRIVATTAILGEFAREVAGPDATVATLMPPGADPHSYEAPTQAARDVAAADVIVVNGYHLEGGLLNVIAANRRSSSRVIVGADGIPALAMSVHEAEGRAPRGLPASATAEGDPHLWLDPDLAAKYVERIAGGLAEADPEHAAGYRQRGEALATRLRVLRVELANTLAPIPPDQRRIVVFHDAFAYFARAFDFQLAAGVLPEQGGREPSAASLAATVGLVRAQDVTAIYAEPQFPTGILDAIARETGATVLVLYSDAYGNGVETYEDMMRTNALALVQGLGPPGPR